MVTFPALLDNSSINGNAWELYPTDTDVGMTMELGGLKEEWEEKTLQVSIHKVLNGKVRAGRTSSRHELHLL